MRSLHICVLFLAFLVAACSSGPTVTEYAEDLEALVTTMNARLDELDAELSGEESLEQIQAYAEGRILARSDFLADLRDLEPPNGMEDVHSEAMDILEAVTAAEAAMADEVMTWQSESDIVEMWTTPEGIAARTADARAVAMCLAAQAGFDDTADRAELEDLPWIPPEMKEVIRVAFGCETDDR